MPVTSSSIFLTAARDVPSIGQTIHLAPRNIQADANAAPDLSCPAIGCPTTKFGSPAAFAHLTTSALTLVQSLTIVSGRFARQTASKDAVVTLGGTATKTTSA